jgi:protein involved in polysaccharide export with SLBB domain
MNSSQSAKRCTVFVRLFLQAAALCLVLGCSGINGLFGGSSSGKPRITTSATTSSEDEVSGRLRHGDELTVRIDAGPQQQTPQALDVYIDEDGAISLPLVGRINAAGLTTSELAEHIEANYMPRYYVRCTATVTVAQRFFYVGGEVRGPSRFLWSEDTTLLKAISTAGGFTDYANHRRVELIHGKDRQVFDYDELRRNPSKDVPVRPGDTITVPRSVF